MKGSAALAAMIRKKSVVLYGSPGGENLEGTSTTTMSDQIPASPEPEKEKPVKYQPSVTPFSGANKCCMCEKTVYKTEEMIAVGRTWHTACFTCGGSAGNGCGRVLRRDGYSDHNSQPYCNACSAKGFKPQGFGYGSALSLDTGAAPAAAPATPPAAAVKKEPEATPPPIPAAAAKDTPPPVPAPVAKESPASAPVPVTPPKPLPAPVLSEIKVAAQIKEELKPVKYTPKVVNMAFNNIPKCTICAKSVYKMEEMVAVGRIWHLACFTCGGSSKEPACHRVLKRDGYVDHENNPFCNACHSKLFKPKGFGYGAAALSTDYGPVADAQAASATTATQEVTAGVAKMTTSSPSAPAAAPIPKPGLRFIACSIEYPSCFIFRLVTAAAPAPVPTAAPAPAATPAPAPAPVKRGSFTSEAAVSGADLKIGASSRSAGGVFKEAAYVGNNDEVDESEWD
jgi:cysteine/glycine-rich protein